MDRSPANPTAPGPGALEPVRLIAAQSEVRSYRLPIEGMTCTDCEHHVVKALREAGAPDAVANFRRGEARFTADTDVAPRRFWDAVAAIGYRPGELQTLAPAIAGGHNGKHRGGDNRYDLAIVGSGGAAFAAAITATERGARVVMVERGTLGGTCVNVGCVPSKTQLRAGELFWHAGHQPFSGVHTEATSMDLPLLVEQKDALVAGLRQEKYANLIDEYGWQLVTGEAVFDDPRTLRVGNRSIRADGFILATGARPSLPPIPGLSAIDYLTSTSLLDLKQLPEHLVVVGAGYIGLELGQLFRHLGSRVTLVQRGERLLREYDPEISDAVQSFLMDEGVELVLGATFVGTAQDGARKRLLVRINNREQTIEGDALLVATGRTPNTDVLNAAAAKVELGHRGEIVIDDRLRTSNPRVFAAGDVTLGPQYVYVAAHEGALAAENALGGNRVLDLKAVPGVTFTTPSVATVGLTEAQARAAGHDVKVSVLPLHAVPRALVNHDERGVFKVVADSRSDQVLGVHIVAENAGDVIYAGVLAVKFHLTVRDLTDSFAPYLTMSEGLKLAAQTFGRDVSKLSCCAA